MLQRLNEAEQRMNDRELREYAPGVFMKKAHYNPNDLFRRELQPMRQIYYRVLHTHEDQRLIAFREAGSSDCAYAFLSDSKICVYGFTPVEIIARLMPVNNTPDQLRRTFTTISAQLDALTR
jgi:hypothetical protein